MKTTINRPAVRLILTAVAIISSATTFAQWGYIYVHHKNLGELSSVPFTFRVKNSSGTVINTFTLNDLPTADNSASSSNFSFVVDMGATHGNNGTGDGNGEMFVAGGLTSSGGYTANPNWGSVYWRQAGSGQWSTITGGINQVTNIDGGYTGQFVYSRRNDDVVHFNDVSIGGADLPAPSSGNTVTDVTCGGGKIAAVVNNEVYIYSGTYTATALPVTTGTWTKLATSTATTVRIDLNNAGTLIAYAQDNTSTIYTIAASGGAQTSLGAAGDAAPGSNYLDVAYDDGNHIYATSYNSANGGMNIVSSYYSSTWTKESEGFNIKRLTGAANNMLWGSQTSSGTTFGTSIFYRALNASNVGVWIDDDKLKTTGTGLAVGSGAVLNLNPGTYTIEEVMPDATWDLVGAPVYGGNTTVNFTTNIATTVITANSIGFIEFENAKFTAKSIPTTCTTQMLQSFNTADFGSGTYGTAFAGTPFHYSSSATLPKNYYQLSKSSNNITASSNLTDHTASSGFFLAVQASGLSGSGDEFFRQRVTNLVAGLSYTISFYAANLKLSPGIAPQISFGLDDGNGNVIGSTLTGNFPQDYQWHRYTGTFTATATTLDVFLNNYGQAGPGNVLAIDDISIAVQGTGLSAIATSPAMAPAACLGTNYTLSNTITGGVWSSSNSSVISVNTSSGLAQPGTAGAALITYTYTNTAGCVTTATKNITVAAAPASVSITDVLGGTACALFADTLKSAVTGGLAPYTYAWTATPAATAGIGAATAATTAITPTVTGSYTYSLQVTDANGCAIAGSFNYTAGPGSFAAAVTATATTAGNNCKGVTVNLTGTGGGTYAWSSAQTGNGLAGTTTASTTAKPTAAGAFTYVVTVTQGACTGSKSVTVNIKDTAVVSIWSNNGRYNCDNYSFPLKAEVTGGTGPYTYAWSSTSLSANLDPGIQSPSNGMWMVAKPVGVTDINKYAAYQVKVTDANGCVSNAIDTVLIVSPYFFSSPQVTITSPTGPSTFCPNGTVTIAYSYTASHPVTTGFFYLGPDGTTVNNLNSTSSPVTIPAPTKNGNFVIVLRDNTGFACLGMMATQNFTALPGPSVAPVSLVAASCNGQPDSIYSNASGGTGALTYAWTVNPATTPAMTVVNAAAKNAAVSGGVSGTTYKWTVTATDVNGCKDKDSVAIVARNFTKPTITNMPATTSLCTGNSVVTNPTVTAGGSPSLTYSWAVSPSATGAGLSATNVRNPTIAPTAAGSYTYTLTVTDANNCGAVASTNTITVGATPSVSLSLASNALCGSTGSIPMLATASGGSGLYSSYTWSGTIVSGSGITSVNPYTSTTSGNSTGLIDNGGSGTTVAKYSVTVTDASGCTATATSPNVSVTAPPTISSISATTVKPCVGNTFSLSAGFSGGGGSYTYNWTPSPGVTIPSPSGTGATASTTSSAISTAQTYNFGLQVTDANGCTATGTTPVTTIYSNPAAALSTNKVSVCANPASGINLTGSLTTPTTGPYTYAWTGSGVTNNTASITTTATPATTGTYQLNVIDSRGCVASATSAQVSVNQATPIIAFNCGTNTDNINYGYFYETKGVNWTWTTNSGGRFYTGPDLNLNNDSNVSHLQSPYVVTKGDYTVNITDATGCIGSAVYTVSAASCVEVLAEKKIDFYAIKNGNEAALSWYVSAGTYTNYFIIERSSDGRQWAEIGRVNTAAQSGNKYTYNDALPINGINYYRITAFNNGLQVVVSQTRQLIFNNNWGIKVYPNPVDVSGHITLSYSFPSNVSNAQVVVTSVVGGIIFTKRITNNTTAANQATEDLNIAGLPAGNYMLRVVTDKWESKTLHIIKQ